MQVCPVCGELCIGEPSHILPWHVRAKCPAVWPHSCANHFHKIRFSPFSQLATRREVRRLCRTFLSSSEDVTVAVATSACIDQILSVFSSWSFRNRLTVQIRRDFLGGQQRKASGEIGCATNWPD